MDALTATLLTLGGLFLLGLVTDIVGRHTPLPRVTLLLLFGFAIGPSVLDLLPEAGQALYPAVTHVALAMVGFLLGGKLDLRGLREHGLVVLSISLSVTAFTALVVYAGLSAIGMPLTIALILAGVATATDPLATSDVVRELGAKGPFSTTLLGIVALDDVWGLVVFSVLLTIALSLEGQADALDVMASCSWELGGAIGLGVALGVPLAYVTGRIAPGEPTLAEALGAVLVCAAAALWMEVSFLLASMVLGATVSNLARHHTRPFHAIEGIEWPFMILFFALAGAQLQVGAIAAVGLLGGAYVALRVAGRLIGGWAGAAAVGVGGPTRRWMGVSLLPQAGVAIAMAVIASERFPSLAGTILTVVVGAIVLFEIVGPIVTRRALVALGETTRKN